MESTKDIIGRMSKIQEVGEKECENCGAVYKLFETPRGIMGACKPCADENLKKKLNLPTIEEFRNSKERNFILSFERVSDDLKKATVSSYRPQNDFQLKAKQSAIKFVKGFNGIQSLAFSGNPGLGKSHLAYAVTKAIRDKKYKALYIKVTDLFDRIKSTYGHHSQVTEEQIFRMINDLDLLVLDDIGSEYVKANDSGHETWASDVLYKIFDLRLNKSVICTTNYSESELQQKYGNNGPRIISRMMNNATGIRLEGEDHRRQEAF
ncbi:phage DNA replication protein (predicted replicative helicase loader) [Oceanobacillus limi]|uniref:Phage DNA replication protein (Predicted replicative helicase loader) n=1 Tax=Oceanobacillus limi TaxID=930131 RepID=A0A1I0HM66_9BACI|nr:ATP-binding protein [Oceanobacillus limi]SET85109.1 phage DNA replication protein (predicted replicative helicase loader) [Oceanobacillus limi]